MKISVGFDERQPIIDRVLSFLLENDHIVFQYGPKKGDSLPWPEVARKVAEDITTSRSDEGILFCWTGTGVCLAANKVKGIRAALCIDAETARGARLWNNANVLCMSLRLTSEAVALEILKTWFLTSYQPNPTDEACLAMIEELDHQGA